MKNLLYSVTIIFYSFHLHGNPIDDRGFYGKVFIARDGWGEMYVPYKEPDTSYPQIKISGKRSDTDNNTTSQGSKISLGYYIDFLQFEMGYFKSTIEEQSIHDKNNSEIGLHGILNYYDIKAGIRYSKPGDTAFHWLYLGGREMRYETNYNETTAKGIGYNTGYTGFFTFDLYNNFEFIIQFEFLYGVYRKNSISSNVDINPEKKSVPFYNISLGTGIQYEPYNISLILKISAEKNYILYKRDSGKIAAGAQEILLGFEIIYFFNKLRYNQY